MKESFFKILGITAGAAFAVLITWVAVGAVNQTSAERHALETELSACQPYLPGTGNIQGEVNVPYFTDRSDAFAISGSNSRDGRVKGKLWQGDPSDSKAYFPTRPPDAVYLSVV